MDYEINLYLHKNSQDVKKVRPMQKMKAWKKLWNPKWRPRSGCDSRIMAKFLITAIQANLCCLLQTSLGIGTKFTWIIVIKNFAIILPSQPLLDHHLGFYNFFHAVIFLHGLHLFLQQSCFCLDFMHKQVVCDCSWTAIVCSFILSPTWLKIFI